MLIFTTMHCNVSLKQNSKTQREKKGAKQLFMAVFMTLLVTLQQQLGFGLR